ncbi:MAG: stealth conserved region 3 domain-containing protein [Hyphomonadaceae bacterium]
MSRWIHQLRTARSRFVYSPAKSLFSVLGYNVERKGRKPDGPPERKPDVPPEHKLIVSDAVRLSPREGKLSLLDLISFLESQGLTGVVENFKTDRFPLLCVLSSQKQKCIETILKFCVKEGVELRYRSGKNLVSANSVKQVLTDWLPQKSIKLKFSSLQSLDQFWFRLEFFDEKDDHYMLAANSMISRRLWKRTAEKASLFQPGNFRDYSEILNYPRSLECNFEVDLVFTWVNSEDPDWLAMYQEYRPAKQTDGNSKSRFKSRDELKYALRSWEQFAPFIRKIFVVSNCAPPEWLDLEHSGIRWVYHEEILPSESLPTFSSHAIETSLYKIEGLSNYFIYSNDDFLLTRPANLEDFYHPNGIAKVRLEPYGMVNGVATEGHPDYLNAARNSNSLLEKTFQRSTTQLVTHSPQPLRKDVMIEMEAIYDEPFSVTRNNKFRAIDDIAVTGYLHAHYAILTERAVYDSTPVVLIQQNHQFVRKFSQLQAAKDTGSSKLPLSVCLNDGNDSHLNDDWNNAVANFLDSFFPNSSSMERQ